MQRTLLLYIAKFPSGAHRGLFSAYCACFTHYTSLWHSRETDPRFYFPICGLARGQKWRSAPKEKSCFTGNSPQNCGLHAPQRCNMRGRTTYTLASNGGKIVKQVMVREELTKTNFNMQITVRFRHPGGVGCNGGEENGWGHKLVEHLSVYHNEP